MTLVKSKVERDIKLTEKFGSFVSRRTAKGINEVASAVENIARYVAFLLLDLKLMPLL